MNSHNATDPEDDTRHLDSLTTMRPDEPRDEVDQPHQSVNPVETPSMPAQAARPAAAIALTALLALSACGGGDEPPPKETTSSSSSDAKPSLSKGAEKAYREYWKYNSVRPNEELPEPKQKAMMTQKAYDSAADTAARTSPTKLVGKDKLLSTGAKVKKSSNGYTAKVTVCYEVHRQALALKAGGVEGDSWEKGEDLRVDGDGMPITPGTKMADRVVMKRGLAENASWKVDETDVDVDANCNTGGRR